MKFNKTISPELRSILKACTTVQQRNDIAHIHGISPYTLMAVLNGKRDITETNKSCIIDLLELAINNAKEFNQTLVQYYNTIK